MEGHNKQTIHLNLKCFKKIYLKARTSKANQIHDYFIKLKELLHEVLEEESNELRKQLENKDKILLETKQTAEEEKNQLKKEKLKEI